MQKRDSHVYPAYQVKCLNDNQLCLINPKYIWSVSFLILILFRKVRVSSFCVVAILFSFQELGDIFTPTEKEAVIIVLNDKENKVEIGKVRYIFTFYQAQN